MNLVSDHVLKPLIKSRPKEDHDLEPLTGEPIVHNFITVTLVAKFVQVFRDLGHSLALERCRVTLISIKSRNFAENALNQVTDCHSGWNSVWVNNHVRIDTFNSKRQVFLSICHAACSFLTVPRCELVSDLRNFDGSHFNLDHALLLFVRCDHNLVDVALFRVLKRR